MHEDSFKIMMYTLKRATRDRGSTRSASARRWGGDRFGSWAVITLKMVPTTAMSGARHK